MRVISPTIHNTQYAFSFSVFREGGMISWMSMSVADLAISDIPAVSTAGRSDTAASEEIKNLLAQLVLAEKGG